MVTILFGRCRTRGLPAGRGNHFPVEQVIFLPLAEKEKWPGCCCKIFGFVVAAFGGWGHHGIIIIDSHIRFANYFQGIALHYNSGGFVQPNTNQRRGLFDEIYQIKLAVAFQQVLINGRVFEKAQAVRVIANQYLRQMPASASQIYSSMSNHVSTSSGATINIGGISISGGDGYSGGQAAARGLIETLRARGVTIAGVN